MIESVNAGPLSVGYVRYGPHSAPSVILLHGFPYDIHAYDSVWPILTASGVSVVIPYLRGYGSTRFLSDRTPRSGQQAALASDLLALMEALSIDRALLAGYDWGGRAACIVSALWPERVTGLVSCNGYNIQNIALAHRPERPEIEYGYWYQYYFHSERGREGLQQHRNALCRLLWSLWSPHWTFSDATYDTTAAAFDNPDFVDVVIHSYRHRFGLVSGDPHYEPLEQQLAEQPSIRVPSIVLDGDADGVTPLKADGVGLHRFTDLRDRRVLPGIGHNVPQESPQTFARAILDLMGKS